MTPPNITNQTIYQTNDERTGTIHRNSRYRLGRGLEAGKD